MFTIEEARRERETYPEGSASYIWLSGYISALDELRRAKEREEFEKDNASTRSG